MCVCVMDRSGSVSSQALSHVLPEAVSPCSCLPSPEVGLGDPPAEAAHSPASWSLFLEMLQTLSGVLVTFHPLP